MSNKISTRILKTDNIDWRELKFIQQDDFKTLSDDIKNKLKSSLIANNFIQPFYVWQVPGDVILCRDGKKRTLSSGITYCLDGKHRTLLLEELITEGFEVPDKLPGIFIDCKNKQDAAQLVLVFSSMYAKITQQGLYEFIKLQDIDFSTIKETIDLPGLSLETMKDWFLSEPAENDLIGLAKHNPITLKITFQSKEQIDTTEKLIKEMLEEHCPGAYYSMSGGEL